MSGYLRKMARAQAKANKGLMNRMVRNHQGLLQEVESCLVKAFQESKAVDDRACHAAIEAVLMGQTPQESVAAMLATRLNQLRLKQQGISDDQWKDALRVVDRSIRNHSQRRPGEVDYLVFVNMFIG